MFPACIRRDLKMDNLMLASNTDDTNIIIIDFGCMVELEEGSGVYTSRGLEGTEGSSLLRRIQRQLTSPLY